MFCQLFQSDITMLRMSFFLVLTAWLLYPWTADEVQTTLEQQNPMKLHADFDQFDILSPREALAMPPQKVQTGRGGTGES